jgi:hypothetical protein
MKPQGKGRQEDGKVMDDELNSFKRDIDLRAYAASQGYQLDRKESWHGSSVMRHPATDDKVIIKRSSDGVYIYFSVRDEQDNGSIIDFVQNRTHMSLGAVRKELRPWIGKQATPSPYPDLPRTKKTGCGLRPNLPTCTTPCVTRIWKLNAASRPGC